MYVQYVCGTLVCMHMHECVYAHVCRYAVTTVTLFFEGRAFNVPVAIQTRMAALPASHKIFLSLPISRIRIKDAAITLNSGPYGK